MIQIQQDIQTPVKPATNWLAVIMMVAGVVIVVPPTIIVAANAFSHQQTTIVSPVSSLAIDLPDSPNLPNHPDLPSSSSIYSPSDYLTLSQRSFNDAQILSQNRVQTDEMKKEILGKLQQSIDTISEGIKIYPNRSDLLTQRATIYIAIQSIAPEAVKLAQKDLEQAQLLSQHGLTPDSPAEASAKAGLPSLPNGLELIKDQQALARNVIVASPQDGVNPYQQTTNSSATTGWASIPAGSVTIDVVNTLVTDSAPIYVVPEGQIDGTLSVVKKTSGKSFTVSLDKAISTDIRFQYWITK